MDPKRGAPPPKRSAVPSASANKRKAIAASKASTAAPAADKPGRTQRREPSVPAEDIYTIVYTDADLLVVNKSAGFPVVPSGAFHRRSVLVALSEQGMGNLYPISLLDPEATGLVLLSRSEAAAQALRWNWRSNLCERQYLAVAQGDIAGARGRITLTIGAVRNGRTTKHQVLPLELGGRPAVTTWKLLARGRGLSRLLVTLQGGRCHQIRIHLAAIGFPIVNDRAYALQSTEVPLAALLDTPQKHHDASTLPPHQIALHCARVRMPHPITNQPMELTAPVPRILLDLMPGAWVVDAT
ncbi:MAG: RluA family pseudouridine synthase [Myxococcota bacterium]